MYLYNVEDFFNTIKSSSRKWAYNNVTIFLVAQNGTPRTLICSDLLLCYKLVFCISSVVFLTSSKQSQLVID